MSSYPLDSAINSINNKLCDMYPNTTECKKYLPISKIKLGIYVLLIIIGVGMLKNGPSVIIKILNVIFRKANNVIGLLLIVIGSVSLLLALNKPV
jgi:hypothetical protein